MRHHPSKITPPSARQKPENEGWLYASLSFSIIMLAGRVLYSGSFLFLFLLWNLFLAWIPYLITRYGLHQTANKGRLTWLILFVSWLLFLPNSFYILTDLFHLKGLLSIGKWFDLTLIASFAWNGLLLGILSIREMEKQVTVRFRLPSSWIFLFPVMLLNGMGVYIGRYLRFNSWDIICNPFALVSDILGLMLHPLRYHSIWIMMICFSFFLLLLYTSIKNLARQMQ